MTSLKDALDEKLDAFRAWYYRALAVQALCISVGLALLLKLLS